MKKLLALSLVAASILIACTKTNTITNTVTVTDTVKTTVTVKDTVTIKTTDTIASNFDYLTAHTWMYNLYYVGYTDSSNLGTLEYQRGASGNILALDGTRTTYNADGTITQTDPITGSFPGTWKFINDQQTLLTQVNSSGTYNVTILKIDSGHFYWLYPQPNGQIAYAEAITAQ